MSDNTIYTLHNSASSYLYFLLQEASFVYDPKILQSFPKEVNHDVLFREGQTFKVSVGATAIKHAVHIKVCMDCKCSHPHMWNESLQDKCNWYHQ